ncbi:hypothetical protein HDE_03220 [Halotydeus destructor]|nr:hypothetical protein HDE_03220 [Halotydeus destructor]
MLNHAQGTYVPPRGARKTGNGRLVTKPRKPMVPVTHAVIHETPEPDEESYTSSPVRLTLSGRQRRKGMHENTRSLVVVGATCTLFGLFIHLVDNVTSIPDSSLHIIAFMFIGMGACVFLLLGLFNLVFKILESQKARNRRIDSLDNHRPVLKMHTSHTYRNTTFYEEPRY